MKTLSRRILLFFVLAAISGVLLHSLYQVFPNPIIALFAPVRESLWEHTKILYWPLLVSSLLLTRGSGKTGRAPWLLSLLVVCCSMLVIGYTYHIILGGDRAAFDIALYFVLMGIGFLLPRLFWRMADKRLWATILQALTVLLGAAVLLFSFCPPDGLLFVELSAVRTWITIPV